VAGAGDAGCHCYGDGEFREQAGRTRHRHASERCKPATGGRNVSGERCRRTAYGHRATRDRATRNRATRNRATRDRATRDRATRNRATRNRATRNRATRDRATRDRAARARATGRPRAADGRDKSSRPPSTRRAGSADRPRGAGRAKDREEYRGLQLRRCHHRQHEPKRGALTAHLVLERSATCAALDVGARRAARQHPSTDIRDQLACGGAGAVAGITATDQGFTGLEDECLHLLSADAQHGCNLRVGLASELEQDQSGALIGREALHVLDHLAEVLAPTDRIRGIEVPPIDDRVVHGDRLLARAQLRQAPVACDRV
jgi:hypothetical protein